jgi:Fe-S-cluster-containing dehydrogenase component
MNSGSLNTDRRSLLKGLAAAAVTAVVPVEARAAEVVEPLPEALGMLYDTTLCIGCKACVVACKEANGMPPDVDGYGGGLYDAPEGLDATTRNVIQLAKLGGDETSYVKKQCMHCVDPACVGACMMHALTKDRRTGIVSWNGASCVGCRYCQLACPYEVPKFEWTSANPRIIKCELCRHRMAEGKGPACCEVCPRHAVIYGKRSELLQEARRRLAESPGRYLPKIYGEHDGGGTQVLYISHVPFEKLGFPQLGEVSSAATTRAVQGTVYKGFVAPLALYGVLGLTIFRNRRRAAEEGEPS